MRNSNGVPVVGCRLEARLPWPWHLKFMIFRREYGCIRVQVIENPHVVLHAFDPYPGEYRDQVACILLAEPQGAATL